MFLDKYLFVLQNFTDAEKLIKINTKLQTTRVVWLLTDQFHNKHPDVQTGLYTIYALHLLFIHLIMST